MTDELELFFKQRPTHPTPSDRASQATIPRRSRRESEGRCRHHADVLCSCR